MMPRGITDKRCKTCGIRMPQVIATKQYCDTCKVAQRSEPKERAKAARNREIARRYWAGETGPALAQEYGLTRQRISEIAIEWKKE